MASPFPLGWMLALLLSTVFVFLSRFHLFMLILAMVVWPYLLSFYIVLVGRNLVVEKQSLRDANRIALDRILNAYQEILLTIINLVSATHPSLNDLLTRANLHICKWQSWLRSRDATFTRIPTELKMMIARNLITGDPLETNLEHVIFTQLPSLSHQELIRKWYTLWPFHYISRRSDFYAEPFAPTMNDLVNPIFTDFSLIVPKAYALDMLFPNGVVTASWRPVGDTAARRDLFDRQRCRRDFRRPGNDDFYHLYYILLTQFRANEILEGFSEFTRQAYGKPHVRAIMQFLVFLGTTNHSGVDNQARYDYLRNLSTADRELIDSIITDVSVSMAYQNRDEPPDWDSPLSYLWHDEEAIEDRYAYIEMIPRYVVRWRQFTRSGIYETLLKSWLLTLSADSLYRFFSVKAGREKLNDQPLWFSEYMDNRTQLQLTKFPGSSVVRVAPDHNMNVTLDDSMEQFCMLNPYYMWHRALNLFEHGQPLQIANTQHPSGNVGQKMWWDIDIYRNVHPDWKPAHEWEQPRPLEDSDEEDQEWEWTI